MKGRGWGGLEASARPELVGVEGLGGAPSRKNQQGGGEGLGGKEEAASSCCMIGEVVEEWREGRRGWRRAGRAGAGWGGGHRQG